MSRQRNSKDLISLKAFLYDKKITLLLCLALLVFMILFLLAYHVQLEIIILICVVYLAAIGLVVFYDYGKRRTFYRNLIQNLDNLDQAYLILETLETPNFYDGEILYQTLYRANKSMAENVQAYRQRSRDFQDYVEMWIHEVKTPLATLAVISKDPRINEQIRRLDDYVEQILYFARAENAERDYLIKPVSLAKVIGEVANRNREIILAKKIDFEVSELDYQAHTDAKWLGFIINQILNNSIKYGSSKITISAKASNNLVHLKIHDNGIGINEKDLPRVFEKSFTGSNGHNVSKSTGMGLYIAKVLCEKLGHQIKIHSEQNKFTDVEIILAQDEYYNVLDKVTKK